MSTATTTSGLPPPKEKDLIGGVQFQIKDRKSRANARVAIGEERAQLWKMMVEHYGGYADVQNNTEREFPVVVLEPVPS